MRISTPSNLEDVPPPYSSVDSHASIPPAQGSELPVATSSTAEVELPASTTFPLELPTSELNTTTLPVRTSLRGGYLRPVPVSPPEELALSSAVAYFEERSCTGQYPSFILKYQIILDAEVTREDLGFPQPEDRYRARDVTTADWSTFVNFLLPEHHLSPLEEATRYADKKEKRPVAEVDTPERREQIEMVIGEWNSGFFGPRGIRVFPEFPISTTSSSQAIPAGPTPFGASTSPQSTHPPTYDEISTSQPPNGFPQSVPHGASRPPAASVPYLQEATQDGPSASRNPQNIPSQRSRSSSTSSSASSISIPSISTTDLEGTTPAGVSTTLTNFRLSSTTFTHLSSSIRQLHQDIRSQRRPLSKQERKQQSRELKAQTKAQKKEIKREVKQIIKEVQAMKKEEKRLRGWKAGPSSSTSPLQQHPNAPPTPNPDFTTQPDPAPRTSSWRDVVASAVDLARHQSLDATSRASAASYRAREQAREAGARGLQHGLDAGARAREQAMEAHRRASETAFAAGQRGVDAEARAREQAGRAAREAREAHRKASETAFAAGQRGVDAEVRAREQAGRAAREARGAHRRASETAFAAGQRGVDAEVRAREAAARAGRYRGGGFE